VHNGWLQHRSHLGPSRGAILLLHAVIATCHGIEAERGPARNGGRERDIFLAGDGIIRLG
jgi:hypothetical protein